ncbi:asparaginase domain-containing protein [Wenyingzhuangia sp. IMCC45533]
MKTLVLYTGGTIGMVKNTITGTLSPGNVSIIQEFVENQFPNNYHKIDVINTKVAIDSSNFNIDFYQELSGLIEANYQSYHSILVLMGTDTMAYVASLLSYCIKGLSKPILFTGGQLPLGVNNSDSFYNLKESIQGLRNDSFPKEVGIYFNKKWMRAVNAIKVDSKNRAAYDTPNSNQNKIELNHESFEITSSLNGKISVFKFIPWQDLDVLKLILKSNRLDGLILEVYGAGNLPNFDTELQECFINSVNKGLQVVVVSQCIKGGLSVGAYEASQNIKKLNFINGHNLSTESASAKLLYGLTKKMNPQQIRNFFNISFRGE